MSLSCFSSCVSCFTNLSHLFLQTPSHCYPSKCIFFFRLKICVTNKQKLSLTKTMLPVILGCELICTLNGVGQWHELKVNFSLSESKISRPITSSQIRRSRMGPLCPWGACKPGLGSGWQKPTLLFPGSIPPHTWPLCQQSLPHCFGESKGLI